MPPNNEYAEKLFGLAIGFSVYSLFYGVLFRVGLKAIRIKAIRIKKEIHSHGDAWEARERMKDAWGGMGRHGEAWGGKGKHERCMGRRWDQKI